MKTTKTMIRFFTIADYEEEEQFLRKQHQQGWRLTHCTIPCFFHFEACEPKDVVYRLDFRQKDVDKGVYFQMFSDYGWEYLDSCACWNYFRKAVSETDKNPEIFSDNASKLELIQRVIRQRLIPLVIIFLLCVIPNLGRTMDEEFDTWNHFFTGFWLVMFVIYLYLIIHSIRRFNRLKRKYRGDKEC